jgi:peptidyl-tRNA hydrolase
MPDEDPIVMYIVVRRSLNLTAGKVGGQCGHAVHYFMRAFAKEYAQVMVRPIIEPALLWDASPDHTKVVLGATDEEFEQVKK